MHPGPPLLTTTFSSFACVLSSIRTSCPQLCLFKSFPLVTTHWTRAISSHHPPPELSSCSSHRNPLPTHVNTQNSCWVANWKTALPLMKDWGLSPCPHHSSVYLPPLPSNAASWLSLELYFCFLPSLFIALSPPNHPCIYPVA